MSTTLTTAPSTHDKLLRARDAAARLAQLSSAQKNAILFVMAEALVANEKSILAANRKDMETCGLTGSMRDRLLLNPARVKEMARGIREVANLTDPIDQTVAEWTRPNGLRIRKVRVPLGVVGIIYESRPNVTADTVALTLKTGNAIVLRGGKEAARSDSDTQTLRRSNPCYPGQKTATPCAEPVATRTWIMTGHPASQSSTRASSSPSPAELRQRTLASSTFESQSVTLCCTPVPSLQEKSHARPVRTSRYYDTDAFCR